MAARLIHMKCQNCGANLELDLDHLMAYCPYCGEKLMIDVDQLNSILIEKEKTKRKEMEYSHEINMRKMDNEETKENDKAIIKVLVLFFVGILIIMVLYRLGILVD